MRGSYPIFQADPMYTMLGASRAASAYYASPVNASPRTLAGRMRDFVTTSKLSLDIALEDEKLGNTYTTMDRLQGTVTITAQQNVNVDRVDILFLGECSRTDNTGYARR